MSHRAVGALVVLVAVQLSVPGLYLPPVFKAPVPSDPPQTIISLSVHTAVCNVSGIGCVGGAGGCPTIRAGIVSPAGVQIGQSECIVRPKRSFHCRSTLPCDRTRRSGRVGRAGGRPTVRAGIVSPAGVQKVADRLRPRRSFHCQSTLLCD